MFVHTNKQTYKHTYTHACPHNQTHIHTCLSAQTNTHTYIHTHTGLSKLLEAGNKKRKTHSTNGEPGEDGSRGDSSGGAKEEKKDDGGKKRDPQLASLVSSLKSRKWPKN